MNIFEAFETKPIVEDGKWFDLSDTAKIKLRYLGSEVAKRAYENLMRPFAQRQKLGLELTEAESKKVNVEFLSSTIILDWQGITGKDGEVIEYSPEAVATLCEALPRFTALIFRIATDESNFEKELVEAEVGN